MIQIGNCIVPGIFSVGLLQAVDLGGNQLQLLSGTGRRIIGKCRNTQQKQQGQCKDDAQIAFSFHWILLFCQIYAILVSSDIKDFNTPDVIVQEYAAEIS